MSDFRLTGGCQCGAVRYALLEEPSGPHICHCRMCQKAFGSFFAPLTGVSLEKFELTRGELAIFKSSDLVERGFCRNCGTPLTFRFVDSDRIAVSIGSLDEPEKIEPQHQFGIEARLLVVRQVAGPRRRRDDRARPTILPAPPQSPLRTTSTPTTTRPSGRRRGNSDERVPSHRRLPVRRGALRAP